VTIKNFKDQIDELKGISGLHFHNLCELNSDALERTLAEVEKKFSFYFKILNGLISAADIILRDLIMILRD